MTGRVLVYGFAVAGEATVRALLARGTDVVVVDDAATDARRERARELGLELIPGPLAEDDLAALVRTCSAVVPAPGVPERHVVVHLARTEGVPLRSEIDLAYEWEQERPGGPRPLLAVTGTDGKTTTTLMAVAMLEHAGCRSVAAGNTEVPLVDAIELDLDAHVVECASFRLAWTPTFRADAAAWLNLAEDHLDWHDSMTSYEAAKARIWANARPGDVAVGAIDDPIVERNLARVRCRQVRFGPDARADYRVAGGVLISPHGELCAVGELRRGLPHDLTNALAAAALVAETGLAAPAAIGAALRSFVGPPHRIELVAERDGVRWFDDSKATTPHAAATAIRGFDSVVLVAGGRNKGLDLRPMAAEPHRIRAVVAIGEAASAIAAAFDGLARVVPAATMAEAVQAAAELARPGDVVLLSPGCASFDWYGGYAERGDDFARLARALTGSAAGPGLATEGGPT